MKFEFQGTIIDLYEKTDILKNWTRTYAYIYNTFIAITMATIVVMIDIVIAATLSSKMKSLLMPLLDVSLILFAVFFFTLYVITHIIHRNLENQKINRIEYDGKILIGDFRVKITENGEIRIEGKPSRIFDPTIEPFSHM